MASHRRILFQSKMSGQPTWWWHHTSRVPRWSARKTCRVSNRPIGTGSNGLVRLIMTALTIISSSINRLRSKKKGQKTKKILLHSVYWTKSQWLIILVSADWFIQSTHPDELLPDHRFSCSSKFCIFVLTSDSFGFWSDVCTLTEFSLLQKCWIVFFYLSVSIASVLPV